MIEIEENGKAYRYLATMFTVGLYSLLVTACIDLWWISVILMIVPFTLLSTIGPDSCRPREDDNDMSLNF